MSENVEIETAEETNQDHWTLNIPKPHFKLPSKKTLVIGAGSALATAAIFLLSSGEPEEDEDEEDFLDDSEDDSDSSDDTNE